jgi:Protein of unknown function (DUF3108)
MPKTLLHAVLVALALSSLPALSHAQLQPVPPNGEKLTFDVSWTVFPAGQLTSEIQQGPAGSDDPDIIVTKVRSQGFVSLLFNVEDEFRSHFNPQSGCSEMIEKKVNEGKRHKQTQIEFDEQKGLALLDEHDLAHPKNPVKHAENEIPPCVQDVISAFYYLRRAPLEVGHDIHLPVNDGAKTYDVTVEVQTKEKIQTPMGEFTAFRLEPRVFSGLFKRKGRMLIWITDDDRRLLAQIKAMISVGTITGALRSVTFPPAASGGIK